VAGQVGFREQKQPRHTARIGELVPHGLTDNAQVEVEDNGLARRSNCRHIAEGFRRTSFRVY
jgi:hypothetical protein